jgi:hypothetical protein
MKDNVAVYVWLDRDDCAIAGVAVAVYHMTSGALRQTPLSDSPFHRRACRYCTTNTPPCGMRCLGCCNSTPRLICVPIGAVYASPSNHDRDNEALPR